MKTLYDHTSSTLNICEVSPHICANHSNIRRIHMPQLSKDVMEHHALHGFTNEIIERFHKILIDANYRKGYNAICSSGCSTSEYTPSVLKRVVPVDDLTVTQMEGNVTIIKNIIYKTRARANPTQEDPIVISNDKKIVDGHHRWMALKFMKKHREAHAYVIDMPHAQSMILAWILSSGQHAFNG